MSGFWTSGWGTAVTLAPFVIGLSGSAIMINIACSSKFQLLLNSLERSRSLHFYLRIWRTRTLLSRTMVISAMCGLLWTPTYTIRKGGLNSDDNRNFPIPLKRQMLFASGLVATGFLWLMINAGLRALFKM